MTKKLLVFIALIIAMSFTACGSGNTGTDPSANDNQSAVLDGSLESILEEIYDTAELSDSFREYTEARLQTTEITEDNIVYHLGTDKIEYEDAIASESMMSPSAYALCLVRVKEGSDIEKIKADIKENVDPMKWVCVGVDSKNIFVDNIGDVLVLIMSDDAGNALHEAFLSL